jgi:hypothetical protein
MIRTLCTVLSGLVLLLGATACSGDGGDGGGDGGGDDGGNGGGDEGRAVTALVDGMTTAESPASVRRQNECVAQGLVDSLGVAGVRDAGLIDGDYTATLSEKLDLDTATVIADHVVECWDVEAQVSDVRDSYPRAEDADWDAYVVCMEKLEPLVRDYAIASYTQVDSQATQARLATRTQRCIKPLGAAVTPAP